MFTLSIGLHKYFAFNFDAPGAVKIDPVRVTEKMVNGLFHCWAVAMCEGQNCKMSA